MIPYSIACRFTTCALLFILITLPAIAQPAPSARWSFDEPAPAKIFKDAPGEAAGPAKAKEPPSTIRGIAGNALNLNGNDIIQADALIYPSLPALSITAWVRPGDLSGFREIFRQEGPHRVLFSFQEDGAVLSLGLDVNGYLECDARIDPKQIQDGAWHLCTATFDGKSFRVYLDANLIAETERPGVIDLSPEIPAFIGSSSGQGEFFQGGLDELTLYTQALSQDEIRAYYQKGLDDFAETSRILDKAVSELYPSAQDFPNTIATLRQRLSGNPDAQDPAIIDVLAMRLRAGFSTECGILTESARLTPSDCLTATTAQISEKLERLIALMVEYQPLTECQIAQQTPEDREKSGRIEQLRLQFESIKEQPLPLADSPECYALMLEASQHIDLRPYVNEPVAPYITPSTPETRDLTPQEAQETLERDWLHQVDQDPTPARILNEIRWTRDIIANSHIDLSAETAQLDALESEVNALTASDPATYFRVRALKRAVIFKNPALDFTKMLFVDMPYPQGSEWKHETRHRLGYMAVPGARLLILDGLNPAGHLTQVMPQAPLHGSFWRPDLSFDANKILFCFKPHNEKAFHLYEINTDGSNLKQLTTGIYDDIDPVYLPDGHILFASTRGYNYVRCMPPTNSFELARCDADGKNVYLISYSNEPDYLPAVMDDGRVVYTRWEYTDKPLWRAQKLWTMHPDGTQVITYWGNQSVWPDVMKDARNIPGTRRVMFTGSAHHDWFAGSIGIIDPDKGFNFPDGLTKVTADVEWPECGNGPVDPIESTNYHAAGKYPAYYSPFPLTDRLFLVSAARDGKFLLYLMDIDGNRELIYEGLNNIFHAIPIRPRALPPIIADRVEWPTLETRNDPKPGVLFSNNVYEGAPPELQGKAKFLRILQIDAKTYTYWNKRPYISTGPVVSAVQSEGVKRILGTVPIAEDGSVSFYAPPGQALHFQLLDEQQRALQTMRSFTGLMPGESRGCLGCHESHSRTPLSEPRGMATSAPPQNITPLPWPDNTVSYARYVRPVLDQYCASCHEGDGKGRKTFDTTERPAPPTFSEPYMTLIGRPSWGTPYTPPQEHIPGFGLAGVLMVEAYSTVDPKAYRMPPPMTSLSYKSPLIEWVSNGKHHDVVVDEISRLRLITWVDAMCPYLGDEEVRAIPDPQFQGVDWLSIRPLIATAPVIPRPGPLE